MQFQVAACKDSVDFVSFYFFPPLVKHFVLHAFFGQKALYKYSVIGLEKQWVLDTLVFFEQQSLFTMQVK